MKKILSLFVMLLVIAVVLPLVGNKFVQTHIETKVRSLENFGLGVQKHSSDSSYFSSSEHYEFLLQDTDKFLEYLSQYSDKQIPKYVNATLDGILVGMDVKYSNIPLTKAIEVDIYPLALSSEISKNAKENDPRFYSYIKNFLESKGILYHINYNIVSKDFDGYIKDINEDYTLNDGTILNLKLKKALYKGNGDLIAPKSLNSSIEIVELNANNNDKKLYLALSHLSSSYSFESKATYLSGAKVESFLVELDTAKEHIFVDTKDFHVNISLNDQGEKAELNTKISLESLDFKSKKLNFKTQDYAYDMAINGIDKKTLAQLQTLVSQSNIKPSKQLTQKIMLTGIELISKGLSIRLAQWKLDDLVLNKTQKLGGFDVKMDLKVKEDADLKTKINISPMLIAQNVDMLLNIKVSKLLYANLSANQSLFVMLNKYMKEDGENLLLDVSFKKNELKLNGKKIN